MFKTFYLYSQYKKYNKQFAKMLNIRREKKFERFLLFKLGKSNLQKEQQLRENCKGFVNYYERRNKDLSFKDIDFIVCRIMATYMLKQDDKILELELKSFTNVFCKVYAKNKIEELKGDIPFEYYEISDKRAAN